MSKFGLVVLGAHIGVHIKSDIEKVTEGKILLVEPVPHNIKLIKQNLKGLENIIIEPVTISNVNQVKNFYFIKENSIGKLKKHWASGIGSFDKKHLLNHRSKRFLVEEEDIEEIKIQSLKFSDLVSKYSIDEIDKLIIDVEGSEYEILKDLDLEKIKINSILFEFKHFDGHFKTGRKLEEILRKFELNNYKTSKIDEENILAIRH
mgnify:CR=1 FL=1|tara:strand:+ start:279 stop:893 length:615 start_codon:yes stop_codon:yes gene_type:complete